ncbi:heme biosynthesis HemY N-terminal domain-containing protein [Pseudoroseomonas sp. WGS1072]|uniref:heme biosynthesis HemY N-terminal domain-containing protein n=1 Tax=Roseomonas sp. WGS1072 TaxID=3366816 RepID=UPI003BF35154
MRRALWLLLVCLVVVGAAWGLMRLGGGVEVRVGEFFIAVSLPVLLLALAALFLVLLLLIALVRGIIHYPARLRARREARNRARAEAALTGALVSLAAGDADGARNQALRARRLVGDKPQLLVLIAEAERMAGREESASDAYHILSRQPEARFLGLRGLLRQAIQREDWEAAQALAREAEAVQPGTTWLRQERALLARRTKNWGEALALAGAGPARAPLALAAAGQEAEEARKAELEREAFKADPAFAPGVVAHAARMRGAKAEKRARTVLEQGWLAAPQPDIAEAYLEGEADPLARVKLGEALVARNRAHPESRLLLARLALEAGLTGRARSELEALAQSGEIDKRGYLLLVELERTEQGDTPQGRLAEAKWLRAAAEAPAAPQWFCGHCNRPYAAWAPLCEGCGTVGEIRWGRRGQANLPAPLATAAP